MKKIYSKIDNTKLIHIFFSNSEFDGRQNIVNEDQFIQVAALSLTKDQTFKPHQHLWKKSLNEQVIAQESWVVICGSVRVDYYDIDGSFLESVLLKQGDCTITLEGGHNYQSLEENTLVYEFKTGPYQGIDLDKKFI